MQQQRLQRYELLLQLHNLQASRPWVASQQGANALDNSTPSDWTEAAGTAPIITKPPQKNVQYHSSIRSPRPNGAARARRDQGGNVGNAADERATTSTEWASTAQLALDQPSPALANAAAASSASFTSAVLPAVLPATKTQRRPQERTAEITQRQGQPGDREAAAAVSRPAPVPEAAAAPALEGSRVWPGEKCEALSY